MVAKKKGSKKKRHISKHVLKARAGKKIEGQNSVDEEAEAATRSNSSTANAVANNNTSKENDSNKHTKDPIEASEYLSNWENRKNQPSKWKFNKNTQSWLIRHSYDANKVPKATFKLLLEYLHGLKGESMRSRIREDASRRARRYKEHIKNTSIDGKDDDENVDEKVEGGQSEKDDGNRSKTTTNAGDQLEDESRWIGLSENDKRKEYKRARMILDTFKE